MFGCCYIIIIPRARGAPGAMVGETCLPNLPFFAHRSVSSPQDGCLFRARFANRFWVQVWSHFGPILEPNLVQKSSQKSRAILRQFLIPFWDHVWSHFGTHLDTFWRHFGELCVASTASADMSKTIKNQWFFNDFAMSEGSEKRRKHHLVAKRHRDSQHSSQMTSKSVQSGGVLGT